MLIEKGGYDANFNGEAYSSILFQNANLSVRLTDEFMQAVDENKQWTTHWVTNPIAGRPQLAGPRRHGQHGQMRLGLRRSGRAIRHDDQSLAHLPQFGADQRLESVLGIHVPRRHGLQPGQHQPDEVSPGRRRFDVERFTAACRTFFIAQEILVDHASYPTKRIAENSHRFRPLGLGYSNLGSLLMSSGLAYDSPGGLGLCGAMTALLHGAANLASAELAAAVGPFDGSPRIASRCCG